MTHGHNGFRLLTVMNDLLHGRKGGSNALNITMIQSSHAHTATGNQIDAELIAQAIDLGCAEAGIAEHTALDEQIIKITQERK